MQKQSSSFPIIVGFIIVALGFFFLASLISRFDPGETLQKYWPVLLILLGLGLLSSPSRGKMGPFALIILGILFVFERSGVFASPNGRFFFGLLLGLLGLGVLILSIGRGSASGYDVGYKQSEINDSKKR